MTEALTYIEIDIPVCANTYGTSPCTAHGSSTDPFNATGASYGFANSNGGWTANNASLTAAAGGSVYTETGADPQLVGPTMSVNGAVEFIVRLDIERTAARTSGAWQGEIYYGVSGGHSFSESFRNFFADIPNGTRQTIDIDMTALDAGGTDWISNTITQIRLDLDTAGNGAFIIHGISIGHYTPTKCFNTVKTCQDPTHLVKTTATLRFAVPAEYLPASIAAVPSIDSIDFTPAVISLGTDLGQRATLDITFEDHPDSDTGAAGDKYLSTRSYNPYLQGTFWGKFRARQPYLFNCPLRWITGFVGQALAAMETRHYIITAFDGPTRDGKYTLTASDVLKLADGDTAQAPEASTGYLVANMAATDTTATLTPSGIGATYAASGYLNIGGNEVVSFTRSSDTLTVVRGQLNTTAATHNAQDLVQAVLVYTGADVADIIYDLLVNYSDVPAGAINQAAWRAETAAFLGTVYTAYICTPTSVNTLVSELILQAALAVWWDDLAQQLRLQVLRSVLTNAGIFTPDNTMMGTLTTAEQPDQRVSRVQTYFGQINPLLPLTQVDNYRALSVAINAAAEANYGAQAIQTIYSRWIPGAGRTVADRLGALILGRFSDPPRHVSFQVMRYASTDVLLGGGYQVQSKFIQDAFGAPASIPIQVTQLKPAADSFVADAEEMLFNAPATDLIHRQVVIGANDYNINLRSAHDSIFPAPTSGVTVTFTINAGVIIGSHSTATPAIDAGSWPVGVTVNLIVQGRIEGRGGDGAFSGTGNPGGPALHTRQAINLNVTSAQIWGGGGGGSIPGLGLPGAGGGGGAGQDPGLGLASGTNGTDSAGGSPGGGAPGLPGNRGAAAGVAIDGISYCTVTGTGDIRGTEIN